MQKLALVFRYDNLPKPLPAARDLVRPSASSSARAVSLGHAVATSPADGSESEWAKAWQRVRSANISTPSQDRTGDLQRVRLTS